MLNVSQLQFQGVVDRQKLSVSLTVSPVLTLRQISHQDGTGVPSYGALSTAAWAVVLNPLEDLIVPVATVGWFVDPVAFVREVNEFAWHSLTL